MDDDSRAIAIIADALEGSSLAVTAANRTIPVLAVEEFADEFELTDENIQRHCEALRQKVKQEKGDKADSPKLLAPEIWERMKSTAESNFIYEDML